jgi:hypothetical protein
VQEIIPSTGACGAHAFCPSLANASSLVDDKDESGGHSMGGVVAGNSDIFVHPPNTSSHSSISTGKRKFSALTQDDMTQF